MTTEVMTAVITGAASGIGRALAEALHAQGARLVLADIDADSVTETADRLGARYVVADVADPAAMDELAAQVPDAGLVCLNAGILGRSLGAPWEVSPDDWEHVFAVNVGGVLNGLRAFMPALLERGEPAQVLITASLAGLGVFPGGGAYGPSKHAVTAIAQQAALMLADTPVRVHMICPSLVATGMSAEGVDPACVARQALQALDEGIFAVIPDEWKPALAAQCDQIISGKWPRPPVPGS